jgi:hypothetical protein
MARAALIVATIVDVALATLLVSFSGFIVGTGPESLRAGEAGLAAFVTFCLLAPIVGFALHSFGRPVGGILIAWLPPVAASFMAALLR